MKREWSELLLHDRMEQDMNTYEALKAQLVKDFSELQQLPVRGRMAQVERAFREELIGQHCYDAERSLDPSDLSCSKRRSAWMKERGVPIKVN